MTMQRSRKLTITIASLLSFVALALCLPKDTGRCQVSDPNAAPATSPEAAAPAQETASPNPVPQATASPAPKHKHKHKHRHKLPSIPPLPPPAIL